MTQATDSAAPLFPAKGAAPSRSLYVAALVAALLLLMGDLAWTRISFPPSFREWKQVTATALALAPFATMAALLIAAMQQIVGSVVGAADRFLLRRRITSRSRPHLVAGILSMPPALGFALVVLSRVRGLSGIGRLIPWGTAVLGAIALGAAVSVGTACYQTIVASGSARMRKIARVGVVAAAISGAGLIILDHAVLPRLYQPVHLALRLAGFLALEVALLLGRHALRDATKRPHASARRWFATPLAGGSIVAIAFIVAHFASGSRSFSLSSAALYGGSAATAAEISACLGSKVDASPAQAEASHMGATPPDLQTIDPRAPILPGADLLLITVDALRADHLGAYGYPRPTTPFLDRMADRALFFERAYTAAPHTSFALTSLLTGRPAVALAHLDRLDGHETLADRLDRAGYTTAAFIPPAVFFVESERFRWYRERRFGFRHLDMVAFPENQSARLQTDQVLTYLDRETPLHLAAWVHYFAPHEPYATHDELGPPLPFGTSARDRYDGEVRWVDQEIGRLAAEVRRRYPRTVIVVTSDHGEEFGEHGGAYHGTTLFDEQIRVPLLIDAPGIPPRRITAPVSTLDLVPTLIGLLGLEPADFPPGRDLRGQFLVETDSSASRQRSVVAENGAAMRMIFSAGHKLICDSKWAGCTLFDLVADPGELRDLLLERPTMAARLEKELGDWVSAVAAESSVTRSHRPEPDRASLARARLRDRSAVPALLSELASVKEVASHRRAAAHALVPMIDAGHAAQLRSLIAVETDTVVTSWLLVSLAKLGDATAAHRLETYLRTAPTDTEGIPDLLPSAALALAALAANPAIDLLERALTVTKDVETSCDLFRALSRSTDRAAAQVLPSLYEPIRTRICCAEAFVALADRATLPFVLSKLPDEPHPSVQLRLIEAVRRIGDIAASTVLATLRDGSREPEVRAAAARALAALAEGRREAPHSRW